MRGIVDMHCHLIPGVDDGAATRRDVRNMLQMEYEGGVRTIVLTPHYRKGMFEPSKEMVIKRAGYVAKEASELGLDIKLYLGCEYHANSDMVQEISREKRFRMNGGKYVLIEFSAAHTFFKVRNWIYELVQAGFRPIVAHIERYPQIVKKMEYVEELIELGALVQVDAGAVIGADGIKAKHISGKLLKKEYVHFIGSDAHSRGTRCPNLHLCEAYITKKMGREYARELFVENPQIILK